MSHDTTSATPQINEFTHQIAHWQSFSLKIDGKVIRVSSVSPSLLDNITIGPVPARFSIGMDEWIDTFA